LARFEKDFSANVESPLSLDELLGLLGDPDGGRSREDAIACYLSGSEGWRDAVRQLGGAFADEATRLRERKPD
jgi:hypothetical protein